jgi:hypothetical protein
VPAEFALQDLQAVPAHVGRSGLRSAVQEIFLPLPFF